MTFFFFYSISLAGRVVHTFLAWLLLFFLSYNDVLAY